MAAGPCLEGGDERPLGRGDDEFGPAVGSRLDAELGRSDRIGPLPLREVVGQKQPVGAGLQPGRHDGLGIAGSGRIGEAMRAAAAKRSGSQQQKRETFHRDCISKMIDE